MRIDKVILRAFLSTLVAIIALLAFMVGALVTVFPSTMMSISYDFGNDAASIRYAKRAYKWFDDAYYMEFAFGVAVGLDDNASIEECGIALTEETEYFTDYCARKNAELPDSVQSEYDEYVFGKIAVAKYKQGRKEEAVNYAFDTVKGGFPLDNAVAAVLYTAVISKDTMTKEMIKNMMKQKQAEVPEGDRAYFDKMFALASK